MAPRCARRWLWLLVAVVLGGCQPRRLELDHARIDQEMDRRIDRVLERPDVDQAFEKLLDGVGENPEVSAAGEQLTEALGEDPALGERAAGFMESLSNDPRIERWVRALMRKHPRASATQIEAMVTSRMEHMTDGPVFDQAFDKAFEEQMRRPRVLAAFERLETSLTNHRRVRRFANDMLRRHIDERVVMSRLRELNGSRWPDGRRATELVLQHMLSEDRLARFYVRLVELPVFKRELGLACRELLGAPSFRAHLAATVVSLLDDAAFRDATISAAAVLLSPAPKPAAVENALRQLLHGAAVETGLVELTKKLLEDPALAPIGDKLIAAILSDRQVHQAVESLLSEW